VVDDHEMKLSHVIRGDEHLSNTPSQIQLYEALGWEAPKFAHLSMILGPDGTKLSKRHGATSVMEFDAQGFLPATMRNYLALLGWSTPESQQLFDYEDLIAKFDIPGCQKNPATFDCAKLQWMNGDYIRKLSKEELLSASLPAVAIEQEKYKLLTDIPGLIDIFFKEVSFDEKAVNKVLKKEGVDSILEGLEKLLSAAEPFSEAVLEEKIRGFCEERDLKTGKVFHPIRVAVSGRTQGPTLFGMLELLGREEVLRRFAAARRLAAPV
jgi:glutamyl/glutaminyl-tRNA synthetase